MTPSRLKQYLLSFCLLVCSLSAQTGLDYRVEVFGSAGTGDYTPFWMTSNTYGAVPFNLNNGYIKPALFYGKSLNEDWKIQAGVDLVAAAHHTSSVFVQQLYADVQYQNVLLSIGPKERYNSILNKRLSVGDLNYSTNARPIPEINLSFPEYTTVPFTKQILTFKADFAVGKSFDNDYILETKNDQASYCKDILWHHKSLFLKLEEPGHQFPLSLEFGLSHAVQWGGWSSYQGGFNLPSSLKDLARVIVGKGGGSDAADGDQANVLGNHQGTMHLRFNYRATDFVASAYKQHYFDDNSGMEYANWRDGIWGLEFELLNNTVVRNIVLEYVQTTHQSGPMHFLEYDSSRDVRGGGDDDYYNNFAYATGWSYFGRAIGNALLSSPFYNEDGTLYFKNNRIKALHLGVSGDITTQFSYRTLFTATQAWGRHSVSFLKRKDNFSALLEVSYLPAKHKDWQFSSQAALDIGDLYNDNTAFSLKVTKTGIF